MQNPLEVTFRAMEPSPAMEARIRERLERLERHCDSIIDCHVVVEAPHRHQHQGKLYQVSVVISVPDEQIVVNRHPDTQQAREDPYVALRDTFDAAERQLQDYAQKRRRDVKQHSKPSI